MSGGGSQDVSMAAKGLRWTGAVVLLIIAAVLVTSALVARFARGELLDTDRYVATVKPLASDPAVQSAITNRVTQELVDAIDVPALAQQAAQASDLTRAPAIANLVAGPISDWLESFIRNHVHDFVTSQRFVNLWVTVNRAAHTQVVALLTGDGKVLRTQGDQVILDLGPVIAAVKQDLVDSGFSIAAKIPNVSVQYPLVESDKLPKIQRAAKQLNRLATWLPWIALVVFGLAVWLAPGHRRAALVGCVIVALFMIAVLVAYVIARNRYTDQVAARELNVPAATSIYNTLLRYLVDAARTWLVLMIIIVVWLFLAGPGRIGRGLRSLVGKGQGYAGAGIARAGWHPTAIARFLTRYARWLAWALGIAAAVILLFFPTVPVAIWVSVAAVVLLLAYGILTRVPEPHPST